MGTPMIGFQPTRPLPVYTNNAAALAAGLAHGEFFVINTAGEYDVRMTYSTTSPTTTTTTTAAPTTTTTTTAAATTTTTTAAPTTTTTTT